MSKTKVLFTISSLNRGGAETYLLRFLRYCVDTEFDFTVLSLAPEPGDLEEDYLKIGCRVVHHPIGYFRLSNFQWFYKWVKEEKFDVVCSFGGNFGGIPLTLARWAGVKKRIVWYRRSTDAFGNNPLKKIYNQFVNQLIRWNATTILSNSQYALDKFYGHYKEKDSRFKVIANGVGRDVVSTALTKEQAREKLNIPIGIFLVGHVGRYDPAKNHGTIFKVAQYFNEGKDTNVKFLFCGRGTDSVAFKREVEKYGISEICYCLGIMNEVDLVYRSMDLFFFPSVTEGQPNALIEAMVAGLPVITSNIPPIREALPEDSAEAMINPLDVTSFCNKIKLSINKTESKHLRDWAIHYFNPEILFNEFKKELIYG